MSTTKGNTQPSNPSSSKDAPSSPNPSSTDSKSSNSSNPSTDSNSSNPSSTEINPSTSTTSPRRPTPLDLNNTLTDAQISRRSRIFGRRPSDISMSSGIFGRRTSDLSPTDRALMSREPSATGVVAKKTSFSLPRANSAPEKKADDVPAELKRVASDMSTRSKESQRGGFLKKVVESGNEEGNDSDDENDGDEDDGWDFKCIGLDHDPACPGEGISGRG
ncbi:hypothetical protein K440DRAFT_684149 [Wilcoxina mikolae CBS 423.85]|nr:hypothetical protein K440DRAFT_684149 [Wilcoxina mikolae CBS 423.85]